MHYDRHLRAEHSHTEMRPRSSFDSSYDQRAYGACKFGQVICECIRDRKTTIQDRMSELVPPGQWLYANRNMFVKNWEDAKVRAYLEANGEEY